MYARLLGNVQLLDALFSYPPLFHLCFSLGISTDPLQLIISLAVSI